jgi:hypothetical protein
MPKAKESWILTSTKQKNDKENILKIPNVNPYFRKMRKVGF